MATRKYRVSSKGKRFVHERTKRGSSSRDIRIRHLLIVAGNKRGNTKDNIIKRLTDNRVGINSTRKEAMTAFTSAFSRGFLLDAKATAHLQKFGDVPMGSVIR